METLHPAVLDTRRTVLRGATATAAAAAAAIVVVVASTGRSHA